MVTSIGDADNLWIETREMTGGARNQVEFSTALSPFFSYSGSLPDEVEIRFKRDLHTDRPVRSRTTDPPYEVPICLVYLPTDVDYAHKYIHFEKVDTEYFAPRLKLKMASPGDSIIDEWRESSRKSGVTDETNGGREYGYY